MKFYNKGDTIVYNAAAFQLAEGSMLDALIKQLPGVELKTNGQIFVNGKFVEALLLNGKDFFTGNRQLMLDNLASYTVKDVAVYDKVGQKSEFLGVEVSGDKRYVMDVRLKKEYSVGWIMNMEGGIGTEERYMGRLFAMRFTNHSRLALYGNINNMNEQRKPGETDGWTPGAMQAGLTSVKHAESDYFVEDKWQKRSLEGNVVVLHSDTDLNRRRNVTNFLASGNTYDYSFTDNNAKSLSISTTNSIRLETKKVMCRVNPSFSYDKYDRRGDTVSATFDTVQQNIGRRILEEIYSGSTSSLREGLINRQIIDTKAIGHSYNGLVDAMATVKMGDKIGAIDIKFSASESGERGESFNRQLVNYGDNPVPAVNNDQYFRNFPNLVRTLSTGLSYFNFNNIDYSTGWGFAPYITYTFSHQRSKGNSSLYQLNNLGETSGEFGDVPDNYQTTFDPANSFRSRITTNTHDVAPGFNLNGRWGAIYVDLPVALRNRKLHYVRGDMDTTVTRTSFLPGNNFGIYYSTRYSYKLNSKLQFSFKMSSAQYRLVDLLDINDNTNPMNIHLGNPDLRNSIAYRSYVKWLYNNGQRQMNNTLMFRYSSTNDAIVRGYTYDTSTGVRRFKTYNVDGNWQMKVSEEFDYSFGKGNKRPFTVRAGASVTYSHDADMIGVNTESPEKQTVKNLYPEANFKLEYRFARHNVSAFFNGTWRNISSARENFISIRSRDMNYGLMALIRMPMNIELSTDLTLFTKRGYNDSALNTTNWVWNARLSYTAFKGRVVFLLDGFDMLRNLSNVQYSVNAQGRTETYINVIPRYIMFHVQYRLNLQPKKR